MFGSKNLVLMLRIYRRNMKGPLKSRWKRPLFKAVSDLPL